MAIENYCLPKVSYGWLPEYDNLGRTIILRPGQWLAMLPRMADRTNVHYLSCGITHLIQNQGQIDTSVDRTKRAVMNQCDFMTTALGNFNFEAWTEAQISAAVDAYYNDTAHQTAFVTDQIAEWLTNNFNYSPWNGSQASKWFGTRMQVALERNGLGGRFYGGYDGHMAVSRVIYEVEVERDRDSTKVNLRLDHLRYVLNWDDNPAHDLSLNVENSAKV